jgi:hypothetical protein
MPDVRESDSPVCVRIGRILGAKDSRSNTKTPAPRAYWGRRKILGAWPVPDIGAATDTLVIEKVEAQLEGTRILELLRILVAKTNITISDCIVILLMIYQTYLMLHPPQPAPTPAPEVTVNVTVDTDEIAEKVAKRLKDEGIGATPEPVDRKRKPHK